MSEKTIVTVTCDVCGTEIWRGEPSSTSRVNVRQFLVWFDTEQDEAKPTKPYLGLAAMHLCDECAEKGIRIHAAGAMGRNVYRIEGAE